MGIDSSIQNPFPDPADPNANTSSGPTGVENVNDQSSVDPNDPYDPASPAYDPRVFEQRSHPKTPGGPDVTEDTSAPYAPPDDFYKA